MGDVQHISVVQPEGHGPRNGRLRQGVDDSHRLGGAFIFEIILTAIFVFVVLRVTSATANPATAAIAIGLSLTVVHLVGIPITGTSVNPARSLGPALIVGGTALSQVWLFIVAPLIGGVIAALLHELLYREEDAGLAPEAQQAGEPA